MYGLRVQCQLGGPSLCQSPTWFSVPPLRKNVPGSLLRPVRLCGHAWPLSWGHRVCPLRDTVLQRLGWGSAPASPPAAFIPLELHARPSGDPQRAAWTVPERTGLAGAADHSLLTLEGSLVLRPRILKAGLRAHCKLFPDSMSTCKQPSLCTLCSHPAQGPSVCREV